MSDFCDALAGSGLHPVLSRLDDDDVEMLVLGAVDADGNMVAAAAWDRTLDECVEFVVADLSQRDLI